MSLEIPIVQHPSSFNMGDKYTFHIGNKSYTLDANDLPPYLEAFVGFERAKRPDLADNIVFTHEKEIPLFDVAIKGLQQGYRHIFRSLGSTDLEPYLTICATYDFLGINIAPRNVDEVTLGRIITDVKAGRRREDDNPCAWRFGEGNKSKARDTAFEFVYLLLCGEIAEESIDIYAVKIFHAVYFIVSHPTLFKRSIRDAVRKAYDARFTLPKRQEASLDKWTHHYCFDDETDNTASEEEDFIDEMHSDSE